MSGKPLHGWGKVFWISLSLAGLLLTAPRHAWAQG